MDILIRALVDRWGNIQWTIYEAGKFRTPLVILNDSQLDQFIKQVNEERSELPKRIELTMWNQK
jgi:hypothetical protein